MKCIAVCAVALICSDHAPQFTSESELEMDAAKATLTKRWESLTHPPLIQLSKFLLSWDVAYVSDYGLIELRHPDAGEAGDGDLSYTFYVHPRGDQVKLKEMLSQFHQDPESCFAEFMLHFAGLGEATDEYWRFVDEKEPWLTLKNAYGEDFEGPDCILADASGWPHCMVGDGRSHSSTRG